MKQLFAFLLLFPSFAFSQTKFANFCYEATEKCLIAEYSDTTFVFLTSTVRVIQDIDVVATKIPMKLVSSFYFDELTKNSPKVVISNQELDDLKDVDKELSRRSWDCWVEAGLCTLGALGAPGSSKPVVAGAAGTCVLAFKHCREFFDDYIEYVRKVDEYNKKKEEEFFKGLPPVGGGDTRPGLDPDPDAGDGSGGDPFFPGHQPCFGYVSIDDGMFTRIPCSQ